MTIATRVIDEQVVEGRRLGRHIEHDQRSRSFAAEETTPIRAVTHKRDGILDQGDLGSCTGNAMAGALNTLPFRAGPLLVEDDAVRLYSEATRLDRIQGVYPPDDTGSSGLAVAKAATREGRIAGYRHAFSTHAALSALMDVPVITGVDWYECIPADQRVLTDDLRWTPIQKLEPGDGLIGFDEHAGLSSRYRRAHVVSNDPIVREVVEVTTDRGRVVASTGHLFVRCHPKKAREWTRADALQPGDTLAYFMDPYERDDSWEAGYLAGFFDGEGCVSGYRVDVAQVPGPTLERVVAIAAAKGYEINLQLKRPAQGNWQEVHNMYVGGGYAGALRFLGHIRPERLLGKAASLWEGRATRSRRSAPVIVQDVKPLGREEVYAIGTTERTLIVEGLLSHNSFDHPDAHGLVEIAGQVRGGHEFEIVGFEPAATNDPILDGIVEAVNSWGRSWGVHGRFRFTVRTWRDLLAAQGDVTVPVPLPAGH